jgi:hypothetical protein
MSSAALLSHNSSSLEFVARNEAWGTVQGDNVCVLEPRAE